MCARQRDDVPSCLDEPYVDTALDGHRHIGWDGMRGDECREARTSSTRRAWELCFVARQAAPRMSGSAPPQWVAAATPAVRPQGSARSSPVVRDEPAPHAPPPPPPVTAVTDPSILARYPVREGSMKERSPIWPQWSKRQCAPEIRSAAVSSSTALTGPLFVEAYSLSMTVRCDAHFALTWPCAHFFFPRCS